MLIQDLPRSCPKCSAERVRRSQRKLQFMAVALIWLGMILVIPWAGLILLMYHYSDTIVIPVGPISGLIALAVVSSPAIILSTFAVSLRKAIDMKCSDCGWKQRYLIDKPTRPMN